MFCKLLACSFHIMLAPHYLYFKFFISVFRIHRIHMLDPDPDQLVRGMDPDPDPSIILQK